MECCIKDKIDSCIGRFVRLVFIDNVIVSGVLLYTKDYQVLLGATMIDVPYTICLSTGDGYFFSESDVKNIEVIDL